MRGLVLGASGQIGRAVALEMMAHGWQVDAVTRNGRSLPKEIAAARHVAEAPRADLIAAEAYDAVIDPIAFTPADVADVIARRDAIGAYCVISTASVYADAEGRGFETRGEFPRYPDPMSEDQPRVAQGPGYSAQKVAMEDALFAAPGQISVLRPGAIHGIGARHPREWYFVKRILDGRHHLPLEMGGRSVFATSSAAGIASLARLCVEKGAQGAFNVADPETPSVREIAEAVARQLNHRFDISDAPDGIGHTPWSVPQVLRLSCAKARALGWDGGPDYLTCLPDYIDWMVAQSGDWKTAFSGFQTYVRDPFDYAAEDSV